MTFGSVVGRSRIRPKVGVVGVTGILLSYELRGIELRVVEEMTDGY